MKEKIRNLLRKNKTIFNLVKFIYHKTVVRYLENKQAKVLSENGKKVLETLNMAFKELEVTYWLDFGTLLGAVREKDFIAHDCDIDVSMYLSDYTSKIPIVMEKYGFKKTRDIKADGGENGFEESYTLDGISVDIFYYTKVDDNMAFYHVFLSLNEYCDWNETIKKIGGLVPRRTTVPLSGVEYIDFKGKQYPAPTPIKEHLSSIYGENYMIKDRNFNMRKVPKRSIKILHGKVGKITNYN